MVEKSRNQRKRHAAYTALTGAFLTAFTGFTLFGSRRTKEHRLSLFEFAQLALATYRLGRLVSYDKVFEPYRAPFTKTVPDPSGEGMTVVPKGTGARAAIGDLICCPVCAGTWIAAALVYGWNLFPRATRTFVSITSAVGAAEFLDAATEALQWTGQLARENAGTVRRENESPAESPRDQFSMARRPIRLGLEARRRLEEHERKKILADEKESGNGATVPPPENQTVTH